MSARPVARPWRRYLRVSVRGLIVLVLVIGGGLGWMVRQAHIQREAVAAITKAGGYAHYNWEWTNGNPVQGGKPWAPAWLVDLIGVDYFGHVTDATIINWETDAAIAQVECLTRLQRLNLYGSGITDAWLEHISGLTNLTELDLARTQVTDVGLSHLKARSNLSNLSLSSTRVTDAGLARLTGLSNLSQLDLNFTNVTDAGLVHLKVLSKLSSLEVIGTWVTAAGVKELHASRSLKIAH